MRHPTPAPPAEIGERDGLAYALFLPEGEPAGSVVVLHGADSSKENHFDFARAARSAGLAALAFDQRGHGDSGGELDGRMVEDVAAMAGLLPPGPVAVRGSSMGGYVALLAASRVEAAAVVAICPAGHEHLLRGLRHGRFGFRARRPDLEIFLERHTLEHALEKLDTALLILHAEGDERIPVGHSIGLHQAARLPVNRLITVPGGHHGSVQHDSELQGVALRFIEKAFAATT
jgi:uncharacterized protein